jgi:hypothetical protein
VADITNLVDNLRKVCPYSHALCMHLTLHAHIVPTSTASSFATPRLFVHRSVATRRVDRSGRTHQSRRAS